MVTPKQLREAYICIGNLYGVLESDEVFTLLKNYYPELKKSTLTNDLKKRSEMILIREYVVVPTTKRGHYIVADPIMDEEDWDRIFDESSGKPLYIPPFEEFLRYRDPLYRANEEDYDAITRFIMRRGKSRNGSPLNEYLVSFNVKDLFRRHDFNKALSLLLGDEYFGYEFQREEDIDTLINLINKAYNKTRIPENHGYSPSQLLKMMPMPQKGPLTISLGPNMVQSMLRGEMSIGDYRKAIQESPLPLETKEDIYRQLDAIQKKKDGNRA